MTATAAPPSATATASPDCASRVRRYDLVDRRVERRRHRQGAVLAQLGERRREPAVLEQWRGDAARQGAELLESSLGLRLRLLGDGDRFFGLAGRDPALDGGQIHLQPYEALLRPVMQVALQPTHGAVLALERRHPSGRLLPYLGREIVRRPAAEVR